MAEKNKILIQKAGFVLLVAGVGFFVVGLIFQMVGPVLFLSKIPMDSVDEMARHVSWEFVQLAEEYPEEFSKHLGSPTPAVYAEALRLGRDVYISEGCWHCHSQYVRPIANEPLRYGPVSLPGEYQNELQLPVLFGTRRVGPDLSREGGVRSVDWHMAHIYGPQKVQPGSVMPGFTWLFDENKRPGKKALSLVAYLQWLGSWHGRRGNE